MRYFFVFKTLNDSRTMVKYIRTFIFSLFLSLLELSLYEQNIKRSSKKTIKINVNLMVITSVTFMSITPLLLCIDIVALQSVS